LWLQASARCLWHLWSGCISDSCINRLRFQMSSIGCPRLPLPDTLNRSGVATSGLFHWGGAVLT
jgi:hypothetical protein